MNPIALLWSLLSLPFYWTPRGWFGAIPELGSVWQDRQALRRNGVLTYLSQRHFERAIGRLILLVLILAIGVVSLGSPFVAPTSPRGWLVLVGLLLIPVMIQVDGVRDRLLRRRIIREQRRA